MSFDFNDLTRVGGSSPGTVIFTYLTTDTKTQILATGYFTPAFTTLRAQDLITVVLSSIAFTIRVTGSTALAVTVREDLTGAKGISLTAFSDLRTAELSPQWQYSFEYTVDNTELTINTVSGSGTVTQAESMAVAGTGTTAGSIACLQTKRPARYRSGFGALMRFTDLFSAPVSGTTQLIGLVDELGSSAVFKNGLALGYDKNVSDGLVFGLYRYANDIVESIPLSKWDDPLDGSGPTGDIQIPTNLNIHALRFQYLGAGAFEVFRECDVGGALEVAHLQNYANRHIIPSSFNPNYHGTIFVDNGSTTSNMVLKTGSMSFFIEGKTKHIELQQPVFGSGQRIKTAVTGSQAIFTIRNKTTYAGKKNFIDIIPKNVVASIEASAANNLGSVRIVVNATLGGTPSFSDISTTDSVVEIDTSATTVTDGKTIMILELAGKNDSKVLGVADIELVIAPGETITFEGTSANSATFRANNLWKELF